MGCHAQGNHPLGMRLASEVDDCPVERVQQGLSEYGEGEGACVEPDKEQEDTRITCIGEGRTTAFGGYVGGTLASAHQTSDDRYYYVWTQKKATTNNNTKNAEGKSYTYAVKHRGNTNSVTSCGELYVIRGHADSAAAVTICGKHGAERCPESNTGNTRK